MSNPLNRSALSDSVSADADQAAFAEMSLAERIRHALKDRDFAWLSRTTGVSTSALSDINTKGKIPRADNALKIANALEVSVEWLVTGRRTVVYAKADELRQILGEGRSTEILGAQGDLDLVPVASIDLAYGMGGTFTDLPIDEQIMHFPRPWIESITHTPPAQLTWARGRGDSMSPTINDHDLVLFDRSQRDIREQDAIWALTVGDIGMIKRLRVRGKEVQILSDNERVTPDTALLEEVNIVGRIVFIGRRI
jgi:phage repressor protein C with HTH and peptisase S24 domain